MKQVAAILMVTALPFASVASAQQPDREQMKQLVEFLASGFGDMKASKGVVLEEPADEPPPVGVTAAAIKQGLELYKSSFTFSGGTAGASTIVESEPALVPGSRFVMGQMRWAGTGKPAKGSEAPSMEPLKDLGQLRLSLPAKGGKPARSLLGELTVRYPARVVATEIAAHEINKDKPVGKASCRLLAIENDLVSISCTGESEGIELLPVSASGAVLDTRESMAGPTLIYRELKRSGKVAPDLLEKLVAKPEDLRKEGRTSVMKAKGKVAKVLALAAVDYQTETLPIRAFPEPDFTGKSCPAIPAAHYSPPMLPEAYAKLSEAQVRQGTSIISGRSQAMVGFNDQLIYFELPQVPNSRLATLEVKDFVLKKGGNPVAFAPQGPFQDRKLGYLHSFRMEPTRGDKPVAYDIATGQASLRYPTQVATRKVTAPGKAGDVSVRGCDVRWYGETGKVNLASPRSPLRAYDKQGRALQVIKNFSTSGMDNAGAYSGVRFWGNIAWVEVDEVKQWKDITIPFSLKPAPPLPKE